MKLQFLLILFCFGSCSQQEDFATAFTKCKAQNPLTSLSDVDEMARIQKATYSCIKGAIGPNISAVAIDQKIIHTISSDSHPTVLYYWSIPDASAPTYYHKSLYNEFIALNMLAEKYQGNIKFVGFSPNDAVSVKSFTDQHPLNFPQVADAYSLWAPLLDTPSGGLPINGHFLMFINREGRVTSMSSGIYSNTSASVRNYMPILEACLTNRPYNE